MIKITVKFKKIFRVFENIPKKLILCSVIGTVLYTLFYGSHNLLLAKSITAALSGSVSAFNKMLILLFAFPIFWELEEYIADVISGIAEETLENASKRIYMQKLYTVKPSVLKQNNTGYISSLVNKYAIYKLSYFRSLSVDSLIAIGFLIYYTVLLASYNMQYSLLLLGVVIFGTFFKKCSDEFSTKFLQDLNESESVRDKFFVDSLLNVNTIQKMQSFDFMYSKLQILNRATIHAIIAFCKRFELGFCGFKLITYLYMPLCLLLYRNNPTVYTGTETELLALLSIASVQLCHNMRAFGEIISKSTKFNTICKKLDTLTSDENERAKLYQGTFEKAEIKGLDYTYTTEEEKTYHIHIPYFCVTKGEKIAVYGESGQGKTTLLNVLSSEIETNCVYLNGVQTTERLDCVFVAQDTEIFDMSIRDNLTLGMHIEDDYVLELLKAVGLKSWIDNQPEGLDTLLGEKGCYVSTGQRQRLNLVRGLLLAEKDKEIYLLDEPTSNVDDETEELMIDLIQKILGDKTLIIVTHRPKIKEICTSSWKFTNGLLAKDE